MRPSLTDRHHRLSRIAVFAGGLLACGFAGSPSVAQTTPPDFAAAQPKLPASMVPTKPGSPVVETLVDRPPLEVRKPIEHARHRVRYFAHLHRVPRSLERPALAGIELVAPLPPPDQSPHIVVPLPAYPLDSVATALTTPPPPVVCHRVRRDPEAPDPHLYREVAVVCVPDNP